MNQIERAMLEALVKHQEFERANTRIRWTGQGDRGRPIAEVLLHGNPIARLERDKSVSVHPTAYQYPTQTTVSRLRALGIRVRREGGCLVVDD